MLPKAYLTSHSRMSGSRWVTIPSWLLVSLRGFFLSSSSVYSCYLFLISSTSVRSLLFLSFIVPIFAWNVPLVSPVFFSLSSSIIFLFLCVVHLRKLSYLSSLLSETAFSLVSLPISPLPFSHILFSTICKASSDDHFAFLYFFFLRIVLVTASCTVLRTSIHSSSGTQTWSLESACHLHCIIIRD